MSRAERAARDELLSLLAALRDRASERKFRLFACACCRGNDSLLSLPEAEQVLSVAEGWAEGEVTRDDALVRAVRVTRGILFGHRHLVPFGAVDTWLVLVRLCQADAYQGAAETAAYCAEESSSSWQMCCGLARCVFGTRPRPEQPRAGWLRSTALGLLGLLAGHPSRPANIPTQTATVPVRLHTPTFDPSWLTSTVVALAWGIDERRDYAAMPILADALQDAGCEDTSVLDHCRGPGPHARGCWVVDGVRSVG